MLASLVVVAAGSLLRGVPAADQVVCPPSHHGGLPIPRLWFAPGPPYDAGLNVKFTPTTAVDAFQVDLSGAHWFQEYVGGASNGVYALYDTVNSLYAQCGYEDTARIVGVWRVPLGWVPRAVPVSAEALQVRTAAGITFGVTPAAVERVYGAAPLQRGIENTFLAYEKRRRVTAGTVFSTQTIFYFDTTGLVGIERSAGF